MSRGKVIFLMVMAVGTAFAGCTTTQTVYQNKPVKSCSSPPEGIVITVTDVSRDVALTNATQQFIAEFNPPPSVIRLIGIRQVNFCEEKDGRLSVSAGVLSDKAVDFAKNLNNKIRNIPKGEVPNLKSFAALLTLRNEIVAYKSIRSFFEVHGKNLPDIDAGSFNSWFDETVSKAYPIKIYFNNDCSDYLSDVIASAFGDLGLSVLEGDDVEQIAAKFKVYSTPITGGTFQFDRLDVRLSLITKDGRQLGSFEWNVKGGGNSIKTAHRDAAMQLKKRIVEDLMVTPFTGGGHDY